MKSIRTALPYLLACLLAPMVLVSSSGCGREERWNVLLVTLDTTRADHLASYGHERVQTPNIDRLAAEGVLFASAISSLPVTLPSHSTILTGKYPLAHGVRDNGLFVLGEEQETLAEILAGQGWSTAAAIGGFPLVARFGLTQGFDLYDDNLGRKDDDPLGRERKGPSLFFEERRAALVAEALLPWMEDNGHRPFFAWMHFYDPHQPFDPPPPYDQLYAADPYLGEIAYVDEVLGRVLSDLERLGEYDRTLVVLTADHGEGLGEHNELTHSFLNYQGTQHVPLIIKAPGGARGAVVDEKVGSVDIAPTILDLLGIEVPPGMQGTSLREQVRSGATRGRERPYYAETLSPRLSHGWGEIRTLYSEGWKYIHGPRPELYHLDEDRNETRDRIEAERQRAEVMKQQLQSLIDRHTVAGTSVVKPVDEETRAKLEALGYLSASGSDEAIKEVLTTEGVAPQDRVADVSRLSQVRSALSRGQALAALRDLEPLLVKDPDDVFLLETSARAEAMLGNFDEARRYLERLIALGRVGQASSRLLGEIGLRSYLAGQRESGLEQLLQSTGLGAGPETHYALALVLREMERPGFDEALLGALHKDPAYAPARVELAVHKARTGEVKEAEELFERALADQPYYAKGHYNFGAFLLERQRAPEAVAYFRRATQLKPRYLEGYYGEIVAQVTDGQMDLARETYERLRQIAPSSPLLAQATQLLEVPR